MADINVILIPLKAIVTLYHCHNHIFLRKIKEHSITKENVYNETQYHESFKNHYDTKNHLNNTLSNESYNSNSSSSSKISVMNDKCQKNNTDFVEEVILYESENNKCVMNDNIQKTSSDDNKSELSEEFDDYILVENVNTENSTHTNDNEHELRQLMILLMKE